MKISNTNKIIHVRINEDYIRRKQATKNKIIQVLVNEECIRREEVIKTKWYMYSLMKRVWDEFKQWKQNSECTR